MYAYAYTLNVRIDISYVHTYCKDESLVNYTVKKYVRKSSKIW